MRPVHQPHNATCSLCTPFLLCLAEVSRSVRSVHPPHAGDDAWLPGDEHSPPPAYWDECMSTCVWVYGHIQVHI